MQLRPLVLAVVLLAPAAGAASVPAATVEIRAQGRSLQAEYRLPRAVARLPLRREDSAELRRKLWHVKTPGVRLEGSALVSDRPFKRVALVADAPTAATPNDYAPLLPFSDGGVGVFTGLFDVGSEGDRTHYRFMPARGQRVVLAGRAHEGAVEWTGEASGEGTYVYFGASGLVHSGAGVAVIDGALPDWIRKEVDARFPLLIDYYTRHFGIAAPFAPFVLFSYDATRAEAADYQGSVLPGVLVVRLEGARWANVDGELRERIRWMLAHEAAHFWNLRGRDPQGAAWMHEGSADEFAWRAVTELGLASAGSAAAARDRALNECVFQVGGDALLAAEKDGRYALAYRCGLVLSLYTEAAVRNHDASRDLFSFWHELLDQAGSEGYTQALYVATLGLQSGDPRAAAYVARLAGERFDSPPALAIAFARVGAPLLPAGPAVEAAMAPAVATRLLTRLMQGDCGGGYSASQQGEAIRLHGSPRCATLIRDIDVTAVGRLPLFGRSRDAWAAARRRCDEGRPVVLGVRAGGEVELPCGTPLPELPEWLTFGAVP